MPASANARATPKWSVVARKGRYEFHDHRMHWMAKSVPQQVTDKAKRTKVVDWHVPLRVGAARRRDQRRAVLARHERPGAPVGAFIAFGAIVLLGGAARRRASAAGAGAAAARVPTAANAAREAW